MRVKGTCGGGLRPAHRGRLAARRYLRVSAST